MSEIIARTIFQHSWIGQDDVLDDDGEKWYFNIENGHLPRMMLAKFINEPRAGRGVLRVPGVPSVAWYGAELGQLGTQ